MSKCYFHFAQHVLYLMFVVQLSTFVYEALSVSVMANVLMNPLISLNYKGLEEIPPSMINCLLTANVQHLHMKGNRLTELPESIHLLENLKVLYLQSNRIKLLPNAVGALKNLELLDVSFNYLESLPAEIGGLKKLKKLYAFSNRLRELPKSIEALQNLEVLGIMKNELSSLPPGVGRLTELVELNVDSNYLTHLPKELCNLNRLQELSAATNNLMSIPQDLGRIKTLVNIFVDNNPLLNWLPLSLKSKKGKINIGLNRCGICDLPVHTVRAYQQVNIKWKKSETSTILPKEISHTMCPANMAALSLPLLHSARIRDLSTDGVEATVSLTHDAKFVIRVPTLFELTLRTYYTHLRMSKHISGNSWTDLPKNIEDLLQCPTAHCCQCAQVLFASAIPFICQDNFDPKKPNHLFHFLGLCCSEQCFYQELASHIQ